MSKVYLENDKMFARKRIVCGEIIDYNMDNLKYYKLDKCDPNVMITFDMNIEQRIVKVIALKNIKEDERLYSSECIQTF
jgi:hypothetical protein